MGISNEHSLFASFRKCPIVPFHDASTYMKLNSLNIHLKICAALVHCNLGDGNLGYLVLKVPPATYTILSTLLLMEPNNLGPALIMLYPEPTALVLSNLAQTHADNLIVWREYNDMDRAIKRVIKTIVPKVYLWTLRNRHTRYATVRILDILTHLHVTYGMLEDGNIQAIDMELKSPINEETHFEDFFAQIKDNQ